MCQFQVYKNAIHFCVLILWTLNSLISYTCFYRFLRIYYIDNHVICKQEQFYFFISHLLAFISFLILPAKTSSTMPYKNDRKPSMVCHQYLGASTQSFTIKCTVSSTSYSLVNDGWRWRSGWFPLAMKLGELEPQSALLCSACVPLGGSGAPAPSWASYTLTKRGNQNIAASTKEGFYQHRAKVGWVFFLKKNQFCKTPFLVLSLEAMEMAFLGAFIPPCLCMDSGCRLLQLPIQ